MIHKSYQDRYFIVQIAFAVVALVLILQAMHLQLIDSSYRTRANATAIFRNIIYPSRGLIYDRNNKLLIYNNAMYDLMVIYNQVKSGMDTTKFCNVVGITKDEFKQNLQKDWRSGQYSKSVPFPFIKKVSPAVYARLQECLFEFPGFQVQLRNVRGYPYPYGGQVLGYINEVSTGQIQASKGLYALGDYAGKSGLELSYEKDLRGTKGIRYELKDNLGRLVGRYKEGELDSIAVPGKDLLSSMDGELQKYAEELLKGKNGSVVAIEPSTGEILALISSPGYDPNRLVVSNNRGNEFSNLLKDPLKPLFNRSIQAKYPPGSIFKTAMALIAQEEGVIDSDFGVGCSNGMYYGNRHYGCHSHVPARNLPEAIQHSCNSYFFNVVLRTLDKYGASNVGQGLDTLVSHLQEFGLGVPLGVDIPNESAGNIPTSKYYDKVNKGRNWRSGSIMSIGIGQGEVQLTTLQMANMAAIIANRGYFYTPHLIKGFKDGTFIPAQYRKMHRVNIKQYHFSPVVDGMERVVLAGTARVAAIPDISVCGKTGTAQNPHGEDHSIFFGFAPRDKPKIAIAVFVENAGFGASYGAPIASLMIEKYIRGSISEPRKFLEEKMLKSSIAYPYLYEEAQKRLDAAKQKN
jgi:penicillin-binding protein 2